MSHSATTAKRVKAKKKCCKSGPRCKSCPIVLTRLEAEGFADRLTKRRFVIGGPVPKPVMKRARARKG